MEEDQGLEVVGRGVGGLEVGGDRMVGVGGVGVGVQVGVLGRGSMEEEAGGMRVVVGVLVVVVRDGTQVEGGILLLMEGQRGLRHSADLPRKGPMGVGGVTLLTREGMGTGRMLVRRRHTGLRRRTRGRREGGASGTEGSTVLEVGGPSSRYRPAGLAACRLRVCLHATTWSINANAACLCLEECI